MGITEKKDGKSCANMTSTARMRISTLDRSQFIAHFLQRNTLSAETGW